MGTFGVVLRPPLHEAGAFTPIDDDAVRIREENGVITNAFRKHREQSMCMYAQDVARRREPLPCAGVGLGAP
jgi:hypothetical protein